MHRTRRLSGVRAIVLPLTCIAASLATLAGTASARPTVYGGGVIVDRDPQNDTIASGDVFAIASVSLARAGLCVFNPGDTQDFFKITTTGSTILSAMTVPLTGTLGNSALSDTSMSIYGDANGFTFADNDDGGTDQQGSAPNSYGSVVRAWVVAPGNYEFRVHNVQTFATSNYALVVSAYTGEAVDFEEQEPNNGPAFPLQLGLDLGGPMVGTGSLSSGSDVDYYAVDMRHGQILAAMTTPLAQGPMQLDTPDTVMDIIGTNGATVHCTNDDAGSDSTSPTARGSAVRFKAPTNGRYFIRIRGFNANATGQYALTVALLNPPAGSECLADLNGDGVVNTLDLTAFLGKFGTTCP